MRSQPCRRLVCYAVLAFCANDRSRAQVGCAASPELAVLQQLGMAQPATASHGFRVHDVVVDPLLRRTFLRIEICGSPHSLPILLPFAPMHSPEQKASATSQGDPLVAAAPAVATRPATAAGASVELSLRSDRVNLLLHGRTLAPVAVGGTVDVEVSALQPGEPGHRFHGRLVTTDHVEVEP